MKFTSRFNVLPIACGILAIVGLNESAHRVGSAPTPIVAMQQTALRDSFKTDNSVPIIPAVERISPGSAQGAIAGNFLPIAWYKNKHWWKRNAPIVGGAAAGGLIGGLAGGGKGLIIGGAAGAGGGYLYKHYRDHNHHHGTAYRYDKPAPHHQQQGR